MNGNLTIYYRTLHNDLNMPSHNESYLIGIKELYNFKPHIIYDIGSAVLHWTKLAKRIWPASEIIAFEAVNEVKEFYDEYGIDYHLDVLSDKDGKEVIFYEHPIYLGGNSYYKENVHYSKIANKIYDKDHEIKRTTRTIDSIVKERNFPLPDMIKIDVQGCELDILNGMKETLKNVQHIVVELQMVEYNIGAKTIEFSIPYIENLGYKLHPVNLIHKDCRNKYYCGNGPDADYHFIRKDLANF